MQKTANRDFVKILRFAVSVFLNFYCGSVLVRFGLDTLTIAKKTRSKFAFTKKEIRVVNLVYYCQLLIIFYKNRVQLSKKKDHYDRINKKKIA